MWNGHTPKVQVDIQAKQLFSEFYLWYWGRGERSRRMETGVEGGSTQNFDARLVSIVVCPGEPFSEKCLLWPKSKIHMLISPGTSSQTGFFPKHCNQEGAWRHIQIHIHMHIHIHLHMHTICKYIYLTWAPARPPGRPPPTRPPVPGPCKVYVFVHVCAYVYVYA